MFCLDFSCINRRSMYFNVNCFYCFVCLVVMCSLSLALMESYFVMTKMNKLNVYLLHSAAFSNDAYFCFSNQNNAYFFVRTFCNSFMISYHHVVSVITMLSRRWELLVWLHARLTLWRTSMTSNASLLRLTDQHNVSH